jgi:molybdopterin-guanine dinucleotide biosynthesis protein A
VSPGPAIVAVLAGGAGRRMGGAKALVTVAGRPLVSHALASAERAGLPAIVVAKRATALPPLDVPVVIESDEPRHPLCGVVAALRHAEGRAEAVVAVGCDMPFVTSGLLSLLASLPEAAVVRAGGRLQPLPSRIGIEAVGGLERSLRAGEPLTRALAALEPRVLGEQELAPFGQPARLCFSVNSPADVVRAERWLQTSA